MRGSLKLFTWFGIPVFVHWTFGLIFVYVLWYAYSHDLSPNETLWVTGLFMSIFGSVLLHEYGHALAARRYGVRTRDIVLMPIGGMARLERMPENPRQEFVVAIAGPLVNVLLFILTALAISVLANPEHVSLIRDALISESSGEAYEETGIEIPKLLQYSINFGVSNLILVLFNMIPAFPMDGGRVLRALLSMRIGRPRATKIAAWIGQGFALAFTAWGLYSGNFMLALLGLFVIYAARTENNMVQTESILSQYRVLDVVRPQFSRMRHNDWMMQAIETLHHGLERHFLVFDLYDNLVGLLEEESILAAQRKPDVTAEVSAYMQRAEVVRMEDSLLLVNQLIRQRGYGLVGVVDAQGTLVGVVDEAGLNYFLQTR
ncbi:MAG TPA: site-2 protease family protein [Saprospiraceae bacterium]|nr:site-2 protease family protein [Saprospiraceae bacterium]